MKKLLTPLLLIASTLFFVANANAKKFTIEDFAEGSFIVGKAPKEKTAKEIEEGRKTYWRRQCALQASQAKTEYIAKQLEKVCLEKHGATRSLFDW
jgi:hypothetical protein